MQVALASGTLITICDVSFWFLLPRRSALPPLPAAAPSRRAIQSQIFTLPPVVCLVPDSVSRSTRNSTQTCARQTCSGHVMSCK